MILSVEGVTKSFDGFKAINDLNFYLSEGELRTVIGPNGAGKSTFMDLITGRTRPDSGAITLQERSGKCVDLTRLKEHKVNRLGIARKFQTPSVFTCHTVRENLILSLAGSRSMLASPFYKESPEDSDKVEEVLEKIRLVDRQKELAGALSHGQKQWLEIGMLLAQDPRILLVDEPAAGMSDEETERTGELLLDLKGKHSIVVVEHDMEFVRQLASRITGLHQGSVLKEGSFEHVSADEKVVEVYLGRSGSEGEGGEQFVAPDKNGDVEAPEEEGESLLKLSELRVRYGESEILRGVDFELGRGELLALLGRNGVGKTTTLRAVMGEVGNSGGNIFLAGKNLQGKKPEDRALAGIGYVPQGRDIFPNLSVWENLKISMSLVKDPQDEELEEVMELFPVLKEMLQRKGGVLSGGQQQQLAIGRALLTRPSLLLLDEPTEGIQPSIIDQIYDAILYLRKEKQMTILLVEQYLDFARSVSDRFAIMDRGAVVKQGSSSDLDSEIIEEYLLV